MNPDSTVFVVPIYRLRDVAETIEKFDEHFWSNGHSVQMKVFDDSSLANHQKYCSLLERIRTADDLYYVGPREKEQFLNLLNKKLRARKLESIVRNLFRPYYGCNRNFTLMYTLGALMVSADEINRGKLLKRGVPGVVEKLFDLMTSFKDVLGRKVSDLPGNHKKGELTMDTAMDLETNVSTDFAGNNSLLLSCGPVSRNAVVKMAQTFRSGTGDIDALDFVQMDLRNESQRHANLHDFNELYVLAGFQPIVTKKNWRMDCGVAGYDNRLGLPPFF